MLFRVMGDLLLVVHADVPPSEAEWSEMLRVRDDAERLTGILVSAPPKASINASQRADVQSYLEETGASIAVLTHSKLVRGAAFAVAWFGLPVRAFPPNELGEALAFLGQAPDRTPEIDASIQALAAELN